MITKILFDNYKPFAGENEIEIRPITLLFGKNNSGKSSLTHLICLMESLVHSQNTVDYKQFLGDLINIYTFHNLWTTGLRLGLVNEVGNELSFSFIRNSGKVFLHAISVNDKVTEFPQSQAVELAQSNTVIKDTIRECGYDINDWSFSTDYLGPIRSIPSSLYKVKNSHLDKIGKEGENAFELLVNSYEGDKALYNDVSSWMGTHLDRLFLQISHLPQFDDYYFFQAKNDSEAVALPLSEIGEGYSQVLPVIVQSFIDSVHSINIVEQPELHLHPAVHANIAERLIDSVKSGDKRYVIESHSENFLLALRRAVNNPENPLTSEDVAIYFVDRIDGETRLKNIRILDNGDLSSWPTGVFGEGFELMKDIIRNRK